jgi:cytochrome c-type biogenesis protein CcmH/NrfG
MKYKEMNRKERKKLRQRIGLGVVVALLALGLIGSSMALPLSNLFTDGQSQAPVQPGQEQQQQTAADLEKKVRENPKDTDLLARLADAYLQEDAGEKAVESYEKLLTMQPDNSSARMNLARIYFLMDNYERAVDNLQYEIDNNPSNKEAHYYLGQYLVLGKSDYSGGIQELKKYIEAAKTGTDVVKAKQMLEQWQAELDKNK